MVVYTKILRNFNIKWFINTEKEGKLFCGASKSIISLTEQEPDSSTVLNSYEVFSTRREQESHAALERGRNANKFLHKPLAFL